MQTKFFAGVLLSTVAGVYAQDTVPSSTLTVSVNPSATTPGVESVISGALQTIESVIGSLPTSVLAAVESAIPSDAEQQLATITDGHLPAWFSTVLSAFPEGAQATILSVESELVAQLTSVIGIRPTETSTPSSVDSSSAAASVTSSVSSGISSALSSASTGLAAFTSGASTTLKTSTTTGTAAGTQTGAAAPAKTGAASMLRVSVVGGALAGLVAVLFAL